MEENRQAILKWMSLKPRVNLSLLNEYRDFKNQSVSYNMEGQTVES